MINNWKKNLNSSLLLVWFLFSFLLSWCWGSWSSNGSFSENIYGYDLKFNGNVKLERVWLKSDDLDEITELFQEVWDDVWYRDSLLIAIKFAQWLWVNAFSQDNLDTLEEQWLTLSNVKKSQIWLKKNGKNINCVLVEYEIIKWLISEFPLLYVSQLFIPKDKDIILMSFITESKSSHSNAVNMFKNIK